MGDVCIENVASSKFLSEQNTPEKVKFRQDVLTTEAGLKNLISEGKIADALPDCTLTHYFTPKDDKYGCHAYAREMFIPKDTVIIGKIHRHQHLNFITQGEVIVYTEFGEKHLKAPCTFVSEVGLKRVVHALEDTLWTTVHVTEFESEADLDKIENEVIAPSYEDLGLIASVDTLPQIPAQGV
jgi:quercetin dioxygenase-like cupin family protein